MKKFTHNYHPKNESFYRFHKNRTGEDLKFWELDLYNLNISQKDDKPLCEACYRKKPSGFYQKSLQFQKPLSISSLHQELYRLAQDIYSSNKPSFSQMESLLQTFLSHLYYLETTVDKTVASLLEIYEILSAYLRNLENFEVHKEEPKSFPYLSMEQTPYTPPKKDKKEKTVQYYFNKYIKLLFFNPQGITIPLLEKDKENRRKLRSIFSGLKKEGLIRYEKHKLDRFEKVYLTKQGEKELKDLFQKGGVNQ